MSDRMAIELDEAESLKLVSRGGIGRIAYQSRFGPAVLPVNYKWHGGAVVFRTTRHSALDEDLQTGIVGGEYLVAFEVDRPPDPVRWLRNIWQDAGSHPNGPGRKRCLSAFS